MNICNILLNEKRASSNCTFYYGHDIQEIDFIVKIQNNLIIIYKLL